MTQPQTKIPYLYLTTTGRRSGQAREIEIWFTFWQGKYYIISYLFKRAHWVRNIRKHPAVTFKVDEKGFAARARAVDAERESQLCTTVQRLSEEKYGWSDGLVVELSPLKSPRSP